MVNIDILLLPAVLTRFIFFWLLDNSLHNKTKIFRISVPLGLSVALRQQISLASFTWNSLYL